MIAAEAGRNVQELSDFLKINVGLSENGLNVE